MVNVRLSMTELLDALPNLMLIGEDRPGAFVARYQLEKEVSLILAHSSRSMTGKEFTYLMNYLGVSIHQAGRETGWPTHVLIIMDSVPLIPNTLRDWVQKQHPDFDIDKMDYHLRLGRPSLFSYDVVESRWRYFWDFTQRLKPETIVVGSDLVVQPMFKHAVDLSIITHLNLELP